MNLIDRFTGKSLEDKIGHYSEVYGEVLLGMHRDIETQKKLVHDYRHEMSSLIDEARWIKEEFERDKGNISDKLVSLEKRTKAQSICLLILLMICICLGVLVWNVK